MSLSDAQPPASGEPGWYPDPLGGDVERYYDGSRWTDRVEKIEPAAAYTPKKRAWWRPGWRKMTWALLIWSVLMLIWVIAAAGNASSSAHEYCMTHHEFLSMRECESLHEAGTGVGVGLVIGLWFFGFVVLSIIWFMTRPRGRECPVCGERVKKGRTVCGNCQYDFAAAAHHEPRSA